MRFFYRHFLILSLLILCLMPTAYADNICSSTSSTDTTGTVYDSGGSTGNYSNYENCGFLIQPASAAEITLSFSTFSYESFYDYLYVYDGTNTSGTLLGSFTGSSIPSDLTAISGAMYIVHYSDYSMTRAGFSASWTVSTSAPEPVAAWLFDEPSWDGTSNEVIDDIGHLRGVSVNGANTQASGQVCGSASFDGVDDYLSIAGINDYLKTTASISFWMKTSQSGDDTAWLAPGVIGVEQAGGGDDIFWGWLNSNGRIGLTKGDGVSTQSSSAINNNTWQHIVLTRDSSSGQLALYVNGGFVSSIVGTTGDVTTVFSSIGRIEDTGGTPEYFHGELDELLVFDQVIDASTITSIYNNQQAGKHWDGSTRSCDLQAVAQWQLEEDSWNGTTGEMVDSSGNDYHGQQLFNASAQSDNAAIDGAVGTCGYANLSSGSFSVSGLPVSTSEGDKTTVAFWMRWDGTSGSMPIGWNYYDLWFYDGSFGFNTWNNDIYGISSAALSGGWHHIVAEFTNGTRPVTSNRLWVDGVEQTLTQRIGNPSSSFRAVGSDFRIGGAVNSSYYRFHGGMDEVGIYSGSLTTSQVIQIMDTTRSCVGNVPGYFSISHDNSATYCLNEPITITAHHSDTSVLSAYDKTITLDTQTGSGTWSLSSGNGSLQDSVTNDGLATYTFDSSDNGTASFVLYYPEGNATVNIDSFEGSIRDDDSEGDLQFASTGFSVTASPLSNPPATPINDPVATQVSGQAFTLAIAAFGTDANHTQCGIIETYSGNKNISLSTQYINPTTGTLVALGTGSIVFTQGQATLTAQYNDVGQISLQVTDTDQGLSGQSNHFVVKPSDFLINVTDNPGTDASGSGFMVVGSPFTVSVQAVNALNNPTPNYGNEQLPESVNISIESLVFPSAGNVGTLANANHFIKTADNLFQNTSIFWNEVGSLRLRASVGDGNYLGGGDVTSSPSGTVGRFYPHSFLLSNESIGNACTNFTYLSQPSLTTQYTLTAIDSNGTTVNNYDDALGYPVGSIIYHVEHNNNGNNLSTRFSTASSTWSSGTYSLNDTAAVLARTSDREAPLENVVIGVSVNDTDSRTVSAANMNASTNNDCELAGDCDAISLGSASFYYGRLSLDDAYGPETADLPAKLFTQYWDGQQFINNVYDNCTLIPRSVVAFNHNAITSASDLLIDLNGGVSSAQFLNISATDIGFIGGDAGLVFSAPGLGITTKDFDIDIDLTAIDWLRYDWAQDGNDNNDTALPSATMSFKTYRGHDRILYWRHQY